MPAMTKDILVFMVEIITCNVNREIGDVMGKWNALKCGCKWLHKSVGGLKDCREETGKHDGRVKRQQKILKQTCYKIWQKTPYFLSLRKICSDAV